MKDFFELRETLVESKQRNIKVVKGDKTRMLRKQELSTYLQKGWKQVDEDVKEDTDLDEAVDKSSPVYKEYLSLKKKSVKDLRRMVGQKHRGPVDLSQYDKQGAISDLLRNQFGNKAVAAAMGLKEARQDSAKDVYWQSYSLAVRHALAQAKKKGYEVDEDDIDSEITFGSGKPSSGKTVRHTLKLTKGGKPQKKALHIQVYNRGTDKSPFELNFYIS